MSPDFDAPMAIVDDPDRAQAFRSGDYAVEIRRPDKTLDHAASDARSRTLVAVQAEVIAELENEVAELRTALHIAASVDRAQTDAERATAVLAQSSVALAVHDAVRARFVRFSQDGGRMVVTTIGGKVVGTMARSGGALFAVSVAGTHGEDRPEPEARRWVEGMLAARGFVVLTK